jgi:hypothetical protein
MIARTIGSLSVPQGAGARAQEIALGARIFVALRHRHIIRVEEMWKKT